MIRQRWLQLLDELQACCHQYGRETESVRVIAVTKFHPVTVIQQAFDAGITEIGESRVQEAKQKRLELPELKLIWHSIGQLQTNKTNAAVDTFDVIHGVDRLELIDKIAASAKLKAKRMAMLIQVNVSGRPGQAGCHLNEVTALLEYAIQFDSLSVQGLMTIAEPLEEVGETQVRSQFANLRKLRDAAIDKGLLPSRAELSMGMSGDWKLAVAEGATMIRIGTALFGERS